MPRPSKEGPRCGRLIAVLRRNPRLEQNSRGARTSANHSMLGTHHDQPMGMDRRDGLVSRFRRKARGANGRGKPFPYLMVAARVKLGGRAATRRVRDGGLDTEEELSVTLWERQGSDGQISGALRALT